MEEAAQEPRGEAKAWAQAVRFRLPLLAACTLVAAGLFVLVLAGCGGMSDIEKSDLINSARMNAYSYQHQDAATPGAAFNRAAFCATAAVMTIEGMPPPDAGIVCPP